MIREAQNLRIGDTIESQRGPATIEGNIATTDAHGVPCLRVVKTRDAYGIPRTYVLDAGAPVKMYTPATTPHTRAA